MGDDVGLLTGATVVLTDDGLTTGETVQAAARMLRRRGARRIVLAVPVGAPQVIKALRDVIDQMLCLDVPHYFPTIGYPVGWWYEDFTPSSPTEIERLLAEGQA